MMRTLNRWWEMGLIDQDLFTIDRETLTSRIADNKVGASFQSLGAIGDAARRLRLWTRMPTGWVPAMQEPVMTIRP